MKRVVKVTLQYFIHNNYEQRNHQQKFAGHIMNFRDKFYHAKPILQNISYMKVGQYVRSTPSKNSNSCLIALQYLCFFEIYFHKTRQKISNKIKFNCRGLILSSYTHTLFENTFCSSFFLFYSCYLY